MTAEQQITSSAGRVEIATPPLFEAWPLEDAEKSVPARFEKIVARDPQRLALKGPGEAYSYDQLNRRANQLGHAILQRLGEGEEPVGLLLEHGCDLIVSLLAVLKTGKFYIPLDPAYPAARIGAMLGDAGARLVITHAKQAALARALVSGEISLLPIDELDEALSGENLGLPVSPDTNFNLIYTSGSTGEPKGVLQNHRNLLFDTRSSTHLLKLNAADRFGLVVPCTFGASVSDICGPLLNGGAVFPFDIKREGLERMDRWFRQERITVTHMVPTVFRQWMGILPPGANYPDLRLVKLGGEPLLRHDLDLFKGHFPAGSVLRNALGTTETYMVAGYLMDRESQVTDAVIPVGYPTEGRQVFILGERGEPLSVGEIGQIAVQSRYLSPGYWRKPELNGRVYLAGPPGSGERIYLTGDLGRIRPDGCVEHLGRKDEMVKIRGQRVELGEVELALLELPAVREAVVTAQKSPSGDARLVAYLVPAVQPPPTASELRLSLAQKLPDAMLPAAFVWMERFPLLPFGKVDRRALPPPGQTRPELRVAYAPPRTPVETRLCALLAEIMGIDRVGIEDDFFELGGDSLLASQLAARSLAEFGVDLPLGSLFEKPTVAALAELVVTRQAGQLQAGEVEQLLAELEALTDEEAGRIAAGTVGTGDGHGNV